MRRILGIFCALAFGVLALPVPAGAALDGLAQAITTGNNAWDVAATSLGVNGVTGVTLHNSGSVVVHVSFSATAPSEPQFILAAGERLTLTFPRGTGPTVVWTKGVSAAGSLKVTAVNSGVAVSQDATADAIGGISQVKKRAFTVGFADFTDADTSETETDPAGALPSGAVLMGFRLVVTTGIGGASLSAVVADCGFNGATDVLTDGTNVFTGATSPTYGLGTNALPNSARAIGGLTPQCIFNSTGDDIGDATAGSVTVEVYYAVPAAG